MSVKGHVRLLDGGGFSRELGSMVNDSTDLVVPLKGWDGQGLTIPLPSAFAGDVP